MSETRDIKQLQEFNLAEQKLVKETVFSWEPNGKIDPTRALSGLAPYAHNDFVTISVPTITIIASNIVKLLCSFYQDNRYSKVLEQLASHKEMYIWNGETLEKVAGNETIDLALLYSKPGKKKEILQIAAEKLRVGCDRLEIIDDYRLLEILKGDLFLLPKKMYLQSILLSWYKDFDEKNFDEYLNSIDKEKITTLHVEKFDSQTLFRIRKCLKLFPHLESIYVSKRDEFQLSKVEIDPEFRKSIRRLMLGVNHFSKGIPRFVEEIRQQFTGIEIVQIYGTMIESFKDNSKLADLKFEFYETIESRAISLQSNTKLHWIERSVQNGSELLSMLLNASGNHISLREINLHGLHQLGLPILEKVCKLSISQCTLTPKDLLNLLSCFPKLLEISLEENTWLETSDKDMIPHIPSLIRVALNFQQAREVKGQFSKTYEQISEIQRNYLLSLLHNNPQLLVVGLSSLKSAFDIKLNIPTILPKLHALKLYNCNLAAETTNQLFSMATQIKQLTFLNVRLADKQAFKFPSFPHLISLRCDDSYGGNDPTYYFLKELLTKIPSELIDLNFNVNFDSDSEKLLEKITASFKSLKEQRRSTEYKSSSSAEFFRVDAHTAPQNKKTPELKFLTKNSELDDPSLYRETVFNYVGADKKEIYLDVQLSLCRAYHDYEFKPNLREFFVASSNPNFVCREYEVLLRPNNYHYLIGIEEDKLLFIETEEKVADLLDVFYFPDRRQYAIQLKSHITRPKYFNFCYLLETKFFPEITAASVKDSYPAQFLKTIESAEFAYELDEIVFSDQFCGEHRATLKQMRDNPKATMSALIAFISNFTAEELKPLDGDKSKEFQPKNDWELLTAIRSQKQGVCRHRVWLFNIYVKVFKLFSILAKVRIIPFTNEHHMSMLMQMSDSEPLSRIELYAQEAPSNTKKLTDSFLSNSVEKTKSGLLPFDLSVDWPLRDPNQFSELLSKRLDASDGKKGPLPNATQALLFFASQAELHAFHLHTLQWLQKQNQHWKFIANLKEMIPSRMHEFLDEAEAGSWLIVRWPDKPRSDLVGFNSMLDAVRKFMGRDIKPGIKILILMTKPKIDESLKIREDFWSRFSQKLIIPVPVGLFIKNEEEKKSDAIKSVNCPLYESKEWLNKLTDYLFQIYQEDKKTETSLPIQINVLNPPPAITNPEELDAEFQMYWQTLQVTGQFYRGNTLYQLPSHIKLKLSSNEKFYFPQDAFELKLAKDCKHYDEILHSGMADLFLAQIYKDKIGAGILEKYQKQMTVLVKDMISPGFWSELLIKAKSLNIKIFIVQSLGNLLPPEMILDPRLQERIYEISPNHFEEKNITQLFQQNSIIHSSDPGYTLVLLKQTGKIDEVIPIKMDMDKELIEYREIVGDLQKPHLCNFTLEPGVLLEKLSQGKTVVLKGTFSSEFQGLLAGLFDGKSHLHFHGKHEGVTGKVIIITDDEHAFTTTDRYKHDVVLENCWQLAMTQYSKDKVNSLRKLCLERSLEVKSYNQIIAMLQQLTVFPDRDPLEPWQMINNVDLSKKWQALEYKEGVDEQKERLDDIWRWLSFSPYVMLLGPSASGKSTLMRDYFPEYLQNLGHSVCFFNNENTIAAWAAAPTHSKELRILFLDEATLSRPGEYDGLEGLNNKPASIIYRGKQYFLTPQHKIIFAGNQNREHHEFFAQHGAIYPFPPFSLPYRLKTQVLPLLIKFFPEFKTEHQAILNEFKIIYEWIEKNSKSKYIITIRNLQKMVLSLTKQKHLLTEKEILLAAKQIALQEVENLVKPDEFVELKKLMQCAVLPEEKLPIIPDFILTPAHKKTLHIFEKEFQIRHVRMQSQKALREECKTETLELKKRLIEESRLGTRALLLEGPSGIGKSTIAIEYLKVKGFHNAMEQKDLPDEAARFYQLTPTSYELMEKMLIQAFHEGAVVIIDEINTLPGLEYILNTLLMGADLDGNPPKREGFYLIATQNPAAQFHARAAQSEALINRMETIILPDYNEKELKDIIQSRFNLKDQDADVLVKNFLDKKANSIVPVTLRNLFQMYYEWQQSLTVETTVTSTQSHGFFQPPAPDHTESTARLRVGATVSS